MFKPKRSESHVHVRLVSAIPTFILQQLSATSLLPIKKIPWELYMQVAASLRYIIYMTITIDIPSASMKPSAITMPFE